MVIARILLQSLKVRRSRLLVSTLALTFSVTLLMMLEHIDETVSHHVRRLSAVTDLMVSAPAQPAHLVLYSLFGIGPPPPPLPGETVEIIARHPEVAVVAPVSAMESHRGVLVMGITDSYLKNFLDIQIGFHELFRDQQSALIGATIAERLGYKEGEQLTIARGQSPGFQDEYALPFTIQQILPRTGTHADDVILVSLEGLKQARLQHGTEADLISYINVQLHNRMALLALQQVLPDKLGLPSMAVIPGQELDSLLQYKDMIDRIMMTLGGIIGVLAMILVFFNLTSGFSERRQELELLRMVGIRPGQLALLTLAEPLLQVMAALIIGTVLYLPACLLLDNWLPLTGAGLLTPYQLAFLGLIFLAGFTLAAVPAFFMYRLSLKI